MDHLFLGFGGTDSGLHLEDEKAKLHHLVGFHQLCGNKQYVHVYRACEELNWQYFNGGLNCPLIEVGLTPYGKCSGYYDPNQNPGRILLHQSMGIQRGTLQHEMGHQWQHQVGFKLYPLKGGKGDRDDWHYCQSWAVFCQHTDRVDGVSRGHHLWKKQTSRMIAGKRQKAWNWFLADGTKVPEPLPSDRKDISRFHSSVQHRLRLDGTTITGNAELPVGWSM